MAVFNPRIVLLSFYQLIELFVQILSLRGIHIACPMIYFKSGNSSQDMFVGAKLAKALKQNNK